MGYAGYYSTTAKMKDNPTELESTLNRVGSVESFEILEKISYNTAVQPGEAKFRKLKLSNPKIKATIADNADAKGAMLLMGWENDEHEDDGEVLVLPTKRSITMHHVRTIQEAKEAFQKKQKDMKRSASAASLKSSDPAKARLKAQLEADRLERAGAAPVTASIAKALPNGGSNVTTAGDLGLNSGGCC